MDRSELTIATITLARDEQEDSLLRDALRRLAEEDIPVVVADGGSRPDFINYLKSFDHFTVLETQARGPFAQLKQALATPRGGSATSRAAPYILYTEPDKMFFFQERLGKFIEQAAADDGAGVILAARSAGSFATFPAMQKKTETTINELAADLLDQAGDYCYGPLIVRRGLLPILNLAPDDIGWGWRFFTCGVAHRLGYRITHLTFDLPCPPEQRAEDRAGRMYRMRQLAQNIQGLLLSASIPDAQLQAPGEL